MIGIEKADGYSVEQFLLAFALILAASKIFGELAERVKMPSVLGELLAGVALGGSVLALVPSLPGEAGYETFHLLAEVGVAILLFEIGLETNLRDLLKVGLASALVALVGIAVPFALGFAATLAFANYGMLGEINPSLINITAIAVGSTLTATSVGITARVLSDLNRLKSQEAKIVLGAAVIDDVLGLIILAVVSGLIAAAKSGAEVGVSVAQVGVITLKAFGFLIAAVGLGNLIADKLFDFINKMKVRGGVLLLALSFGFIFAYLANLAGLAPIVGAFAAGLVVGGTKRHKAIQERLGPVADVFTPIFFIVVGAAVNVALFNPLVGDNLVVMLIAGSLFLVAAAGKYVSGFAVFQKGINKTAIGFGMIPRGEVGLIFAQMGLVAGIFDSRLFSALTVMVMLTTFVAPPLLQMAFTRSGGEEIA
ncbi:MAG: cation:proton antiporter [Deltaproteobacteria bacterium]